MAGMSTKDYLFEDIFYIVMLSLVFLSNTIGGIPQNFCFLIISFEIFLALLTFSLNRFRMKEEAKRKVLPVFFKYNVVIKIIIHLYTIGLVVLGITEKRFLSSNIRTYLNAVSAIAIVYLLGEKAWRKSIIALILTWILSVFWVILKYGRDFVQHVEFHDLAFATGYFFLYYIIFKKQWRYSDLKYVLFAIAIIFVTGKRIGMAGLLVAVACHFILTSFSSERKKQKVITFIGWAMLIGCYLFVFLVINGFLFRAVSRLVKNTGLFLMGRNYYWDVMAKMCEFKPLFWGYGRNASATLFTNEYAYMHVGNMHSDILKMYMECGFILFGVWLYNYLRLFVKKVYMHFGFWPMYVFFIMTIYTFFVYLTDNTETYPITQYFYMLVPTIYCLQSVQSGLAKAEE